MIDVHSHIIPGVDDGSKSIEDTFNMILEAKEIGFTDIMMTSHYMTHNYEPTTQELTIWKEKLQKLLKTKNVNVKLHCGMEIYVTNQIEDLLKEKKLLTLGESRYLLMELPINCSINYLDYVVYYLQANSIQLILAHPERYIYVQNNPNLINEFIDKGILIQCNYASIIGLYGKKAQKTMKKILKRNQVHFLGSDCHEPNTTYKQIPQAIKKIKKIIGEDKFYKISTENPKKILNNEELEF